MADHTLGTDKSTPIPPPISNPVASSCERARRPEVNLPTNVRTASYHNPGEPASRHNGITARRRTGIPAYRHTGLPAFRRVIPHIQSPHHRSPHPHSPTAAFSNHFEGLKLDGDNDQIFRIISASPSLLPHIHYAKQMVRS